MNPESFVMLSFGRSSTLDGLWEFKAERLAALRNKAKPCKMPGSRTNQMKVAYVPTLKEMGSIYIKTVRGGFIVEEGQHS